MDIFPLIFSNKRWDTEIGEAKGTVPDEPAKLGVRFSGKNEFILKLSLQNPKCHSNFVNQHMYVYLHIWHTKNVLLFMKSLYMYEALVNI